MEADASGSAARPATASGSRSAMPRTTTAVNRSSETIARTAGGEPQDLVAHLVRSPADPSTARARWLSLGRPFEIVTASRPRSGSGQSRPYRVSPAVATSRAARPRPDSQRFGAGPSDDRRGGGGVGLDAGRRRRPTLSATGLSTGRPVRGSSRWWTSAAVPDPAPDGRARGGDGAAVERDHLPRRSAGVALSSATRIRQPPARRPRRPSRCRRRG